MVAAHAISDRDRAALKAISRGEGDLALDPAELAQWSERPEIRRVLDAALWLQDRRRRLLADRVIEQAMDHLSTALDAKTDLTILSQRAEVRRAATALAELAITLLYGPPRSRSRAAAPTAFPFFSAPRPPGVHSSSPTGPALVSTAPAPSRGPGVPFTRRDEPVSAPAPTPSRGTGVPPVPTPSTRPAHSTPAAPAPHRATASNPPSPLSTLEPTVQSIPQPTWQPALQQIVLAPNEFRPGQLAAPAHRGGATSRSPAAPSPARLLAHAGAADTS